MKARTVEEQGQRIARLIGKNVAALGAQRISVDTFKRRNEWLWRKADQGRDRIVGGCRIHERLANAVVDAI